MRNVNPLAGLNHTGQNPSYWRQFLRSLGVEVTGVVSGQIGNGPPVMLKVQHFWVTETGDTLFIEEAEATAYPGGCPSQPLLYAS